MRSDAATLPSPTASRLAAALERTEIVAAYQPKVSLLTGDLIGVEALARWTDGELGAVPPDSFIPLAEHSGAIARLTAAVLRQSLATCADLRQTDPAATVSVNISPCLLSDGALPDAISRMLGAFDLPPSALIVEITETSKLLPSDAAVDTLTRLRRSGIGCSVDDFGTGFASMLSLLCLPFTELKIDRTFVAACTTSDAAMKIVRATVSLAHDLGLTVVAEGIETEDVARALLGVGCEFGQGYYFGHPVTASALIEDRISRRSRSVGAALRVRRGKRGGSLEGFRVGLG
jgi:EAL domain-containing protein (putative c-di-GMP-specific phosphodiesterase class I)